MRELVELLPMLHGLFAQGALRVVADVLDVFLVAFLVYRVLLLVRGTRAMQMALRSAYSDWKRRAHEGPIPDDEVEITDALRLEKPEAPPVSRR